MRVGDRVVTKDGVVGIILNIYWIASSSSTVSYIGRIDIETSDGTILNDIEPNRVEIINESR